MFSQFLLPLFICIYCFGGTTYAAVAFVAACESDQDCIDARGDHGGCCVKWNPLEPLSVCKDMGIEDDECHVGGNVLPYPFPGQRRFWRCPCGEGLTCVRTEAESNVGTCQRASGRRSINLNLEEKRGSSVENCPEEVRQWEFQRPPRT